MSPGPAGRGRTFYACWQNGPKTAEKCNRNKDDKIECFENVLYNWGFQLKFRIL